MIIQNIINSQQKETCICWPSDVWRYADGLQGECSCDPNKNRWDGHTNKVKYKITCNSFVFDSIKTKLDE